MSLYDAPNQQVVRPDGSGPADEGEGGSEHPEAGPQSEQQSSGAYDPGEHTVDEVKEYVETHPDEAQAVYDAEAEGKQRTTLLEWLTSG